MQYDRVLAGGKVVTEHGCDVLNVAIHEGKIAALLPLDQAFQATQTEPVEGCLVLPGLVDAHVHFREPGLTHKEDFESGTRAAALGGVTTVMVMPTDKPMTQAPREFADKRRLAEGRCHVDFALQALLGPDPAHVRELAALGAASFEIFLGLLGEGQKIVDDERLAAALRAVRQAGRVAGVTPYDDALAAVRPSLPPEVEATALERALAVHRVAGGRMHVRQVSCAASLQALEHAAAGVTTEVTPHNLVLTDETFRRLGAVAKVVPPLRPEADAAAMRAALAARRISIVATDHAPHTPQEKAQPIERAPGGFPGVQTLLPVLATLVADGTLTWPDLVRVACTEPARIFGLAPRKGAIAPGADADLVVVDPAQPMQIRNGEQASKAGLTPFDGWHAPVSLRLTLLRGETVCRDGERVAAPRGRFVSPGAPARVHSRLR